MIPAPPGTDRSLIGGQLRQVTPGPDEGFLHDVIRADLVCGEPQDVTAQGQRVTRAQLAEHGVAVAG